MDFGSGSSIAAQVQGGMVIGVTANFQLQGTSTTERIQTRYLTPIPLSEFLKKDFSGSGQPAYTGIYDRYGNRWKQLYNGRARRERRAARRR